MCDGGEKYSLTLGDIEIHNRQRKYHTPQVSRPRVVSLAVYAVFTSLPIHHVVVLVPLDSLNHIPR